MLRRTMAVLPMLLLGMIVSESRVAAQDVPTWNVSSTRMSRSELQLLLANLETAGSSSAYGNRVSESAEREASLIRERLELGDFRVGDRINISVVGEATLPPQVVVDPGPTITLPVFGTIPLAGVLRSELEAHLTTHIGRFIVNPQVQAESLVRIGVIGSVAAAGFYFPPSDALLDDAIMLAGGLGPGANLASARVLRAGNVVIDEAAVTLALAQGRTIDQLNMAAGDQIVIDAEVPRGDSILRTVFLTAITVGLTVLIGAR